MNETINKVTGETIKYNRIGGTPDNPIYFNDPLPQPTGEPANITGTSLAPAPKLNVPTTTTTSPASSVISEITTGATSDIASAQAEYETLQKATGGKAEVESSAMYQAIQDLFTKKGEVTAGQATAEEQAGITKERTALNDINTRIADQNVQIRQEVDRLRALPMSDAQRNVELNNIQDTYGRRLADLAILKSAAQGNIQGIQEDADRKTKLLLAPIEDALTYYKEFGIANIDNLNKKEQAQLDFLTKNLEKQKADVKDLQTAKAQMIAEVAKNGGGTDQAVINAINNATDVTGIAQAGSKYVGLLDRQSKLSALRIDRLQAEKLAKELNPSPATVGANEDLTAYAAQYADTGKLPSPAELKLSGLSVGQVTSYAKQMPKPTGALVSINTGTKSPAVSPTQEDGMLALYDITKKIKDLKELDKKRIKGLTSAALGKTFGSDAQQKYVDLRGEIVDLLARARTGAALTKDEEEFYASQLPSRIGQVGFGLFGVNTGKRIENFDKKMNDTLQTRLSGQGTAIYGYSRVKVGGVDRTVGELIDVGGVQYKVLPDGTLTDII